jgi:hypothetical protein
VKVKRVVKKAAKGVVRGVLKGSKELRMTEEVVRVIEEAEERDIGREQRAQVDEATLFFRAMVSSCPFSSPFGVDIAVFLDFACPWRQMCRSSATTTPYGFVFLLY